MIFLKEDPWWPWGVDADGKKHPLGIREGRWQVPRATAPQAAGRRRRPPLPHDSICVRAEYVNGQAHTNGMESSNRNLRKGGQGRLAMPRPSAEFGQIGSMI